MDRTSPGVPRQPRGSRARRSRAAGQDAHAQRAEPAARGVPSPQREVWRDEAGRELELAHAGASQLIWQQCSRCQTQAVVETRPGSGRSARCASARADLHVGGEQPIRCVDVAALPMQLPGEGAEHAARREATSHEPRATDCSTVQGRHVSVPATPTRTGALPQRDAELSAMPAACSGAMPAVCLAFLMGSLPCGGEPSCTSCSRRAAPPAHPLQFGVEGGPARVHHATILALTPASTLSARREDDDSADVEFRGTRLG
jgi:hypothetical protein